MAAVGHRWMSRLSSPCSSLQVVLFSGLCLSSADCAASASFAAARRAVELAAVRRGVVQPTLESGRQPAFDTSGAARFGPRCFLPRIRLEHHRHLVDRLDTGFDH